MFMMKKKRKVAIHTNEAMVREGGLLVHTGEAEPGIDWDRLVDDDREERIQDLIRTAAPRFGEKRMANGE